MHCQTITVLALSLAALANGADNEATNNNTEQQRRLVPTTNRKRRKGGLSSTTNYESVSESPLTFTTIEEVYPEIDREAILAEYEINGYNFGDEDRNLLDNESEDEEDYTPQVEDWMNEEVEEDDGIFIDESEEELEYTTDEMNIEEQFVNTIDLAEQEYNVAAAVEDVIIYDDMEDDVVPMDESDEDYPIRSERIIEEPEQVEEEDEGVSLDPEEEEMLVETKGAVTLDVEEGEGSEEVDSEPLEFTTEEVEPIQRKLRRLMDTPVYVPDAKDDEGVERYLAKKESLKDDSLDIFDPALDANGEFELNDESLEYYEDFTVDEDGQDHRDLQNGCGGGKKRIKIQIVTDNSGWENKWEVRAANGAIRARGPPAGRRYDDNRSYFGQMCLPPGQHRFIVYDKFGDGMCGQRTGRGRYGMWIGNTKRFSSPANCNANWQKRVHSFNIPRTAVPAPAPRPQNQQQVAISGRGGCKTVRIQFKIDKFGRETIVSLVGGGRTHLISNKDVGAFQTKTMSKCVPPGTYTLRLVDTDGLCCKNGQGFYKMWVDGNLMATGGYFIGSKSHTIKIGFNWRNGMTARDTEWQNAHNAKRRIHHGGKGYRPVRHSRALKSTALAYANRLGQNCRGGSLVHAQGTNEGENLAKNSGSGSWGQRYSCAKIMNRWVDQELSWPYPRNAHYTQVVWRATQYVGCGESVRQYGNQFCRTQVCRYIRPGNCNVRNKNWRAEAWKDDTGCGGACPNGGCYI